MGKVWMPVEDGNYNGLHVCGNGTELNLNTYDAHGIAWPVEHTLDSDLRLCRLTDELGDMPADVLATLIDCLGEVRERLLKEHAHDIGYGVPAIDSALEWLNKTEGITP